jgi:dienelactone hydrolase
MLAHGLCGSRTNYEFLSEHLASHGFVVAAPDMLGYTREACDATQVTGDIAASARDLAYVCHVLRDTVGPLALYAQRVRGAATGLVGHSLGGRIAVEAATTEGMFMAMATLAPAARAEEAELVADLEPRRAWLVMGGTADALVGFDAWTAPFFDGLPGPAYLVRLTGGTHSGFTDVDAGLSPEALAAQQANVRRYTTAFLVKHVARKGKFNKRLRTRDDGTVAVTARRK